MKRALIAAALVLAACGDQTPASLGAEPAPALAPTDLPAFFDCLRERGATIVSAHRGGPRPGYAENAIETFRMTTGHSPAFLEIDISRTRDGALVLMHDDTVERTTDGQGNVSALTLVQIQALRLQDNEGARLQDSPPTLRQALDWAAGRAILELDVKRGVSYEDVAREVETADAMARVVFITYSVDGASRLARVAQKAMIYTTITNIGDLDTLERRGVDLSRIVAWLGADQFSEELVEALAARGVESRAGVFESGGDFDGAAHAGIQSLAVNDVDEAFRQIDVADRVEGYAAMSCASAR